MGVRAIELAAGEFRKAPSSREVCESDGGLRA